MAKWLAIISRPERENCPIGTFCVKDEYKLEISQVKAEDQFVMANTKKSISKSLKRDKWINGLYTVTGEVSTNLGIIRHSKNSYSHIVNIEQVKESKLLDSQIYEIDLKKYDNTYGSYFNCSTKYNSIKRLSDEEFLIFKKWIDLMDYWDEICEYEPLNESYDHYYLLPLIFDEKLMVKTKWIGNEEIEYHI